MKNKLAIAALAATIATAANANTCTPVTGFYLGAGLGLANTNVKYNFQTVNPHAAAGGNTQYALNKASDAGKMGLLYGLMAGYNMQLANSVVVGAELYFGGDSAKVKTDDFGGSSFSENFGRSQVKRTMYYGLAPRVGYMITPHVLAYVRLGIEGGKWKAEYFPNAEFVAHHANAADQNALKATKTASKNRISFAPGVGVDMFVSKNVFMRAQYTYLFGPKMTINYDANKLNVGAPNQVGAESYRQTFRVTQHAVTFAVGYKF